MQWETIPILLTKGFMDYTMGDNPYYCRWVSRIIQWEIIPITDGGFHRLYNMYSGR